ncbi:hypothetical protein D3C72_1674900 [compost metagenome]
MDIGLDGLEGHDTGLHDPGGHVALDPDAVLLPARDLQIRRKRQDFAHIPKFGKRSPFALVCREVHGDGIGRDMSDLHRIGECRSAIVFHDQVLPRAGAVAGTLFADSAMRQIGRRAASMAVYYSPAAGMRNWPVSTSSSGSAASRSSTRRR